MRHNISVESIRAKREVEKADGNDQCSKSKCESVIQVVICVTWVVILWGAIFEFYEQSFWKYYHLWYISSHLWGMILSCYFWYADVGPKRRRVVLLARVSSHLSFCVIWAVIWKVTQYTCRYLPMSTGQIIEKDNPLFRFFQGQTTYYFRGGRG